MIQAYSTYINGLDLRDFLTAFAAEVEDKNTTYTKMPYYMWRDLKRFTGENDSIKICWSYDQYNDVNIDIFIDSANNKNPGQAFKFYRGDDSFGDFLYEYFLYHKENDMKVKENASEYWDYDGSYHSDPITQHYNNLKNAGKLGVSYVSDKCDITINNKNNKESNAMKFNFDFGPVNSQAVRMSVYGLAIKNKVGTYVSYDVKSGDIVDVDVLNFDGAKFLYKMPVATKDITVGDVIVHQNVPMFVIAINDGYITAIDPVVGERKDIMLTKSPFGFNFATKVINVLGNLGGTASNDNPFGNLGLMLMLGDNKDMGDLLPLMLMGNGGLDMSNPLMLYALMGKDGSKSDLLPLMFMMNAQKPANTCTCGGHCGENHTQG
jgi:hypothetical protein